MVTVCAPSSTLQQLDMTSLGAAVAAFPLGRGSALRHYRRIIAITRAHDVTHAHGVRVGAQLAMACVSPLVVTWHNAPLGPPTRRVVHRLLEGVCARGADVVLGASDDLVTRARSAGARDSRLVPVAAPDGPTPAVAVSSGLHDPPTVLAVARLHPQKRLDLLISAAAQWPPGPDRPRFLIAGDGPLLGALREQARTTNAPVSFLGARDDVPALLDAADVVVLASEWEARPLVAQEALRAGVPLVATDVGGVRGLVGSAAVLVPPGSDTALADGVRRVLTDASLRAELRSAGPAQAALWPTVDDMVDQLLALYRTVCERNGPTD
jgi:glycosyltransferase involved in cell wall biosynthesis